MGTVRQGRKFILQRVWCVLEEEEEGRLSLGLQCLEWKVVGDAGEKQKNSSVTGLLRKYEKQGCHGLFASGLP